MVRVLNSFFRPVDHRHPLYDEVQAEVDSMRRWQEYARQYRMKHASKTGDGG